MSEKKALKGKIWRGGFPGERTFRIRLADGTVYQGIAPVLFCWDARGRPLNEKTRGTLKESSGLIACRVLDKREDAFIVSIPDDEVVAVSRRSIVERPARSLMDVPF